MALFHNQTANVVEWEEYRDDVLFWKWKNTEIKKGSRLILRQGQDAIFMANGRVEGVFRDEGSYDIESEIIPFLSTLKGFRFGFQSGLRAEVLFVNTKEIPMKWGTKNPISIPAPGLPGGMPIRAYGTYQCRVADEMVLIEKIAGIKKQFLVEEVKDRVDSMLSQLLMKWISKEGKDMFHLQSNAYDISKGICQDLDMEMQKIGIGITDFTIASVSYPEEVAAMQKKAAAQSMVGDVNRYTQINMADSIGKSGNGGNVASSMAQMQMGMMMGKQMADQMTGSSNQTGTTGASGMNFCPNCGTKTDGAKFCPNCGTKLS
jgi:membrane protease subunit (stomatin/prohibitin family)